ncbi:hypothetical protein AZF37_05515 [endosymbiont 'TC1' of Trimyema compressum]|uniref:cysteine hydrolase family protein n=1 Tax=endosymbiont 'TC1' of Trimyema compressum TaxID=243899 RepID=UPI0007F124F9|nr:isochorismatase family cysteine hydrolase [endosymbiont 'TC1' of Trimyema compressum]AMP20702.1 hypothetical protein AZF37_05515 [endosymbiont 'TC1' of Trimyema compressum]
MKEILMVIDMENDFLRKGGALYSGDKARQIIPFIKKKIDAQLKKKQPIIFTRDYHNENDKEFQIFPSHCIKETEGSRIIKELTYALQKPNVYLIEKTRFSAFHNTELENLLQSIAKGQDLKFTVLGVCTNICVYFTAEELRNRDYEVTVYENGVASFDEYAHHHVLEQMASVLGIKVIPYE